MAKAERLIAHELVRLNWTSEDLTGRAKSDPLQLALAARLRRETTLSIKQIAERASRAAKGPLQARPRPAKRGANPDRLNRSARSRSLVDGVRP